MGAKLRWCPGPSRFQILKGWISNPTLRRLERGRAKAGSWLDFKSEQAAHPIGPAPSWSSWATACQLDRPGKGWISNPTLLDSKSEWAAPWSSWAKGLHNPPTLALQEFVQPAHD